MKIRSNNAFLLTAKSVVSGSARDFDYYPPLKRDGKIAKEFHRPRSPRIQV